MVDILAREGDETPDRYLDYVPEALKQKYVEGMRDRKLTHLHAEIALLDVRIKSLVEMLEQEVLEPGDIALEITTTFPEVSPLTAHDIAQLVWSYAPENFVDYRTFQRLSALVRAYHRAIKETDKLLVLGQLFAAIEGGERTGDLWHEIQAAMEQRRKLVEIEERRIERTSQTFSLQQVMLIVGVYIESLRLSVERNVQDERTQNYILADAKSASDQLLALGGDPQAVGVALDRKP